MTNSGHISEYELIFALNACGIKLHTPNQLWCRRCIEPTYSNGILFASKGDIERNFTRPIPNPNFEWVGQPHVMDLVEWMLAKGFNFGLKKHTITILHNDYNRGIQQYYHNKMNLDFRTFLEKALMEFFTGHLRSIGVNTY